MTIARVQTAQAFGVGAAAIGATLPAAPANGNLLVAVIGTGDGTPTPVTSIVQTGAIWIPAVSILGAADSSEIWFAANVQSASAAITVSFAATGRQTVALFAEYSGVETTLPLDTPVVKLGFASPTSCGPTAIPAAQLSLVVGGISWGFGSGVIAAPTGGFAIVQQQDSSGTGLPSPSHKRVGQLEKFESSQVAQSFTAAVSGPPVAWATTIAVFKGAPTPPPSSAGGGGWGIDPWGTSPWGGAIPQPPLVLERAVAISTKEVEITLNREAQVLAPTVIGDALNPATWTIQRIDTGFFFSVLSIRQLDPLTFVVSVLQDFGPQTATHRILTDTLLDSDGNPISQPPLNQTDFAGLLAAEAKDELTRARQLSNAVRDIANPPLPASPVGGTLVINSSGDYELESGTPLLKKLIIRRLITRPGDFSHLPDYGAGIGVKEVLPATNLIKLRSDIIRQVLREPEVVDTDVQLTLSTLNELTVRIKARIVTGETVDFTVTSPTGEVVL